VAEDVDRVSRPSKDGGQAVRCVPGTPVTEHPLMPFRGRGLSSGRPPAAAADRHVPGGERRRVGHRDRVPDDLRRLGKCRVGDDRQADAAARGLRACEGRSGGRHRRCDIDSSAGPGGTSQPRRIPSATHCITPVSRLMLFDLKRLCPRRVSRAARAGCFCMGVARRVPARQIRKLPM
jgi:hypothetical protein